MIGKSIEASPKVYAKAAGVFHMLQAFTTTLGGHILFPGFMISGGAVMAAIFLENERHFWFGFGNTTIGIVFHIAWLILVYYLLKPVNRNVALLAAFVMLAGCACQVLACLVYAYSVLELTDGGAFTNEQLQALAFLFNIYPVFFGIIAQGLVEGIAKPDIGHFHVVQNKVGGCQQVGQGLVFPALNVALDGLALGHAGGFGFQVFQGGG